MKTQEEAKRKDYSGTWQNFEDDAGYVICVDVLWVYACVNICQDFQFKFRDFTMPNVFWQNYKTFQNRSLAMIVVLHIASSNLDFSYTIEDYIIISTWLFDYLSFEVTLIAMKHLSHTLPTLKCTFVWHILSSYTNCFCIVFGWYAQTHIYSAYIFFWSFKSTHLNI